MLLGGAPAYAQDAGPVADTAANARMVSPRLPTSHWAVEATRRLEALGLAPGYFPAQSAPTWTEVEAALAEAARRAPAEAPAMAATVSAWQRRFREEFTGSRRKWGFLAGAAGARSRARGSRGLDTFPRTKTTLLADPPAGADGEAHARLAAGLGAHGAVLADVVVGTEGASLPRWEAAVAWRGVRASVGRAPIAYGYTEGTGVVLAGAAPSAHAEIESARAFRLPGPLRWLGPTTFHTALGRHRIEGDAGGQSVFLGMRVAARPHPRVTLAAQRAALFGGVERAGPVTPRKLLGVLVGQYQDGSEFENQWVSGELRYRLPVEPVLPLVAYLEWGTEDMAGGFDEAPGIVVGAYAPSIPLAPGVSAGLEYAFFGVRCCRSQPVRWYAHGALGAAAGGEPLGHPLGGNGHEWLAHATAHFADARLRVTGRAFLREREPYTLFGAGKSGDSRGGSLRLSAGAWHNLNFDVAVLGEVGAEWREGAVESSLSLLF